MNWNNLIAGKTIIQNSYGKRLILEVGASGKTVLMSCADGFEEADVWYTLRELESYGYTIVGGEEKEGIFSCKDPSHLTAGAIYCYCGGKVKPKDVEEEWPKEGSIYCFISYLAEIDATKWCDTTVDRKRKSFGNIFRTREEAQEALEKIKAILKK